MVNRLTKCIVVQVRTACQASPALCPIAPWLHEARSRCGSHRSSSRALLEHLNGIEGDDLIDPDDEDSVKRVSDLTDEELVELFTDGNGDGQPYYQVWCVEDDRQVLPVQEVK